MHRYMHTGNEANMKYHQVCAAGKIGFARIVAHTTLNVCENVD